MDARGACRSRITGFTGPRGSTSVAAATTVHQHDGIHRCTITHSADESVHFLGCSTVFVLFLLVKMPGLPRSSLFVGGVAFLAHGKFLTEITGAYGLFFDEIKAVPAAARTDRGEGTALFWDGSGPRLYGDRQFLRRPLTASRTDSGSCRLIDRLTMFAGRLRPDTRCIEIIAFLLIGSFSLIGVACLLLLFRLTNTASLHCKWSKEGGYISQVFT